MSSTGETVVRRFYEEMCNGRRNDLAAELFTADHVMHDPQVAAAPGPQGVADAISAYQRGVDGHWGIEELISSGDQVIARWTGTGTHVGDMNGLAPSGRKISVAALSVHRIRDGKIAETHQVWDTLGFLQQLGAVPGEGTKLITSGYQAFARQDVPAVLALFDANIQWTVPDTVRFGGTYSGPAGVAQFFSHLSELYQEIHVEPEQFVEQGDRVVVLGTHRGRAINGTPFEQKFVHSWVVTDGAATSFTEFFDTVHMNVALGVPGAKEIASGAKSPREVNLNEPSAQPAR
jgi:steroid delta-isomerase-like uncharacterized protein